METFEVAFSLKVENVLRQIRQLVAERDLQLQKNGENISKWNACLLQSEVFRNFAIIDWMNSLESKRIFHSGNNSTTIAVEIRLLEELKCRVQLEKSVSAATEEDLNLMAIPLRTDVAENPTDWTYSICDVSNVIENQLEKLDAEMGPSPDDHEDYGTNCLPALRSDEQLVEWDMANPLFEGTFEAFMDKIGSNWSTIDNLSKNDPSFMEWATAHFEHRLLNDINVIDNGVDVGDSIINLGDLSPGDKWCDQLNPTTKIALSFSLNAQESTMTQSHIVKRLGSHVWDLSLSLSVCMRECLVEMLKCVKEWFSDMPELRRLRISFSTSGVNQGRKYEEMVEECTLIQNASLPPLPSLKILEMVGHVYTPQCSLLRSKFMQTYGKGLDRLHTFPYDPIPDENEVIPLNCHCPTLSTLTVWSGLARLLKHCLNDCIQFYVQSPLKIIKISTMVGLYDEDTRFPKLLTFLGAHFGSTLESLSLQLFDCGFYPHPSSIWMLDLKFPKLKYFAIDNLSRCCDQSAFLLLFPALETFVIDLFQIDDPLGFAFSKEESILEISSCMDDMKSSNIWKLLPYLNVFSLENGNGEVLSQLTRRECIDG